MNKPELPGRYARMNDIILEAYGQACIEYGRAQGLEEAATVAKAIAENERSDGADRFEPAIRALKEKK